MKKILSITSLLILLAPIFVSAQEPLGNFKNAQGKASGVAGTAGVSQAEPETYVATWISAALSILGIVFLILTVYGGFLWMTAKGDENQATKAKDVITMSVIGLAIVIASYAATKFVVKMLIGT